MEEDNDTITITITITGYDDLSNTMLLAQNYKVIH